MLWASPQSEWPASLIVSRAWQAQDLKRLVGTFQPARTRLRCRRTLFEGGKVDVVFFGSFQVHPRALKPRNRALHPRFPPPCSRQRISSATHVSVCRRRTQRASSALDFWRARSVGMGYACMHALGVCGTLALPRTRIRVAPHGALAAYRPNGPILAVCFAGPRAIVACGVSVRGHAGRTAAPSCCAT